MITISPITPEEGRACADELYHLLRDSVEGGASVGYVLPLPEEEVIHFWEDMLAELAQGQRIILVARQEGRIVGCVHLAFAQKPNATHRAEVQKLLVLQAARRQGIGRQLMLALEAEAKTAGRTLLVLDTASGDTAEPLYLKLGYQVAGVIPQFAISPDRSEIEATTFMYKLLSN